MVCKNHKNYDKCGVFEYSAFSLYLLKIYGHNYIKCFVTYLHSRKDDDTAKAELAKLEKISKVLWDDFQNSRNLN